LKTPWSNGTTHVIFESLDLSDLRQHLAPYYSHTGRPSVDPELMIRMLLIGYCLGIRSERRLCEEVKLNLAYRWFCRLSIEDKVPDHSTFSKNRHGRFREAEAFRFVFEQVLEQCINAGLVSGEGFAVDASVVKADASRQRHHEDDDDWGGGPAIREYLDDLEEDDTVAIAPPKKVSHSDPQARWTAAPGGPAFYAYSTNYLIDTAAGIVVDVEADHYTCPNGKQLKRFRRRFSKPRSGITKANTINYSSSQHDCKACPVKEPTCRYTHKLNSMQLPGN
jgi:transposase